MYPVLKHVLTVSQSGFELMIFLPQLPMRWDYSYWVKL